MLKIPDLLVFVTPLLFSWALPAALHWLPWKGEQELSRLEAYMVGASVVVGAPVLTMLLVTTLDRTYPESFWTSLLLANTAVSGLTVVGAYRCTASGLSVKRMWTMPHDGVSTDWIQEREDELARLTTAKDEHLDRIRDLADILHRRQFITERYYRDLRDSLDFIACALLLGKRNTARLRRRPPQ